MISSPRLLLFLLIFSALLGACNISGNDKNFTSINANTSYKLISFNDSRKSVEPGDMLEYKSYFLLNNKDTLVADSSYYNELFNDTLTILSAPNFIDLSAVLSQLQEGDSCLALFYKKSDINKFLSVKLNANDSVFAYIKLKRIYKGKEKSAYLLEENAIARYITFSEKTWIATENGIYYRITKPSSEGEIKYNDLIRLAYKGYFLNGQVFDNYADINPYFEYVRGTQNQLIKGMEYAVNYLQYGAEAEFIIPSSLAFGHLGSSTGIVKPYKPLLYKVKCFSKNLPLQ